MNIHFKGTMNRIYLTVVLTLIQCYVFLGCEKSVPLIMISTDKSSVSPGETIVVSVTAQSDYRMKYLWATVEVHCAINSDIYSKQYLGGGTLLEIKKRSKAMSGSFEYTVPNSVNGSEFGFGDFLNIIVFCEQGLKQYREQIEISIW
jgi:hypothetical protein